MSSSLALFKVIPIPKPLKPAPTATIFGAMLDREVEAERRDTVFRY
jgi:hypothetical protein